MRAGVRARARATSTIYSLLPVGEAHGKCLRSAADGRRELVVRKGMRRPVTGKNFVDLFFVCYFFSLLFFSPRPMSSGGRRGDPATNISFRYLYVHARKDV